MVRLLALLRNILLVKATLAIFLQSLFGAVT